MNHSADHNYPNTDVRDELKCQMCLQTYDDQSRRPLNLECGHNLCSTCVREIFARNGECPIDGQKFKANNPDDVPLAYTLVSIIDSLKRLDQKVPHEQLTNPVVFNQLKRLIAHMKKDFILLTEKLANHKQDTFCSIEFAQELLERHEFNLNIKRDDLIRLRNFIDNRRTTNTTYGKLLEKVETYMAELDDISDRSEKCQLESQFIELNKKLSAMKISKKDRTIIEQPIEGQQFLNEFQNLIDCQLNEIENDQDIAEILESVKRKNVSSAANDSSPLNVIGNFLKFKIGILGDDGMYLIFY